MRQGDRTRAANYGDGLSPEAPAERPGWTKKWLHFRRFLAHPFKVGSVVPASAALGRLIAGQIRVAPGQYVIELGGGTGAVTKALLACGLAPDRLAVVEIDAELAGFLRESFPGVTVIEGDAFDVTRALPPAVRGRVGAVICGLPVALMPEQRQRQLVDSIMALEPAGDRFVLFGFWPFPPLPATRLGLVCKGLAFTLRNFPPAFVWAFERRR